jgi:hypothetical protein
LTTALEKAGENKSDHCPTDHDDQEAGTLSDPIDHCHLSVPALE